MPWRSFGTNQPGWSVLLAACALSLVPVQLRAQSEVSREYEVKAAFLFHFTQFVEWPSNATASAVFRIGVLGKNPFGNALDETVRGESVNGCKMIVEYSSNVDDLTNCAIVFINRDERHRMPEIMEKLNGRPILTVSDYGGFARNGGIINFYLEDGKIRFEINPMAAKRARLTISSQLLQLGRIIETTTSEKGKPCHSEI